MLTNLHSLGRKGRNFDRSTTPTKAMSRSNRYLLDDILTGRYQETVAEIDVAISRLKAMLSEMPTILELANSESEADQQSAVDKYVQIDNAMAGLSYGGVV